MKAFNTNHDAIIKSYIECTDEKAKDGEVCEHKNKVYEVEVYVPIRRRYVKVSLSDSFIRDIYHQINEIESHAFAIAKEEPPF